MWLHADRRADVEGTSTNVASKPICRRPIGMETQTQDLTIISVPKIRNSHLSKAPARGWHRRPLVLSCIAVGPMEWAGVTHSEMPALTAMDSSTMPREVVSDWTRTSPLLAKMGLHGWRLNRCSSNRATGLRKCLPSSQIRTQQDWCCDDFDESFGWNRKVPECEARLRYSVVR